MSDRTRKEIEQLAGLLGEVDLGDPLRWSSMAIAPDEARLLIAEHLHKFTTEVAASAGADGMASVMLVAMGHLLLENMQLHAERILRERGTLFSVDDWLQMNRDVM